MILKMSIKRNCDSTIFTLDLYLDVLKRYVAQEHQP